MPVRGKSKWNPQVVTTLEELTRVDLRDKALLNSQDTTITHEVQDRFIQYVLTFQFTRLPPHISLGDTPTLVWLGAFAATRFTREHGFSNATDRRREVGSVCTRIELPSPELMPILRASIPSSKCGKGGSSGLSDAHARSRSNSTKPQRTYMTGGKMWNGTMSF
jgi:hypothetical protein